MCESRTGCSWHVPDVQCSGTMSRCEDQLGASACAAVPGCSWNVLTPSSCGGKPSSCTSLGEAACTAAGCEFGAICLGGVPNCSEYTSAPSQCNVPGCSWRGCEGRDTHCGALDSDACLNEPNCAWQTGMCVGQLDCSANATAASCAAQTGCQWDINFCNGQSAPCAIYRDSTTCASKGCAWAEGLPNCNSTAPPCDPLATQDECASVSYCQWSDTFGICAGSATPCARFSVDECGVGLSSSCHWYASACHGTPKDCAELTTTSDCSTVGCQWTEGTGSCSGTPESCATHADRVSCTANNACTWAEGNCEGAPASCAERSSAECGPETGCQLK